MGKYVGINVINALVTNIKVKFAEKIHIHQISDVDGLQRRLDELTPPTDIETSEDVIIRVNQLSLMINDLTNEISGLNNDVETLNSTIDELNNTVDSLTPAIGEIYITTTDENPSSKFGGVWQQIKDTFLLASGDVYSAGSTGGEATHVLTVEEMPAHTHTYKRHAFNRNDTGEATGEDVYGANNKTLAAYMGTSESTGGGQAHNNMPPYLVVNIWKRIA